MNVDVVLSDEQPCSIRRLRMFELDPIRPAITGMFIYKISLLSGEMRDAEYKGERWGDNPPVPPNVPEWEIKEKSQEWYDLREYNVYLAWLTWKKQKDEAYAEYGRQIAHYIMSSCVRQEDRERVVNPADWQKVHKAALVPELTREVLAESLEFHLFGTVERSGDI